MSMHLGLPCCGGVARRGSGQLWVLSGPWVSMRRGAPLLWLRPAACLARPVGIHAPGPAAALPVCPTGCAAGVPRFVGLARSARAARCLVPRLLVSELERRRPLLPAWQWTWLLPDGLVLHHGAR